MKKRTILTLIFMLVLIISVHARSEINLSLKSTSVCASSNYSTDFPVENVTDGNESTLWGSKTTDKQPWLIVKFNENNYDLLTKLIIKWQPTYHAKTFIFGVSNDKKNWYTSAEYTYTGDIFELNVEQLNLNFKYIAVQCLEKNSIAIGIKEFEVWGYDIPADKDMYISGKRLVKNTVDTYSPCIWAKNVSDGGFKRYELEGPYGGAKDVAVFGNSVYSVGYRSDSATATRSPGYWIDTQWYDLTADIPIVDGIAVAMTINAAGELFIAGNITANNTPTSVYWKREVNGTITLHKLTPAAGNKTEATSLCLDDNQNVYVAGRAHDGNYYKPCVWENGAVTTLPLAGFAQWGIVNCIKSPGTGWYAAGLVEGTYDYTGLHWYNGKVVKNEGATDFRDLGVRGSDILSTGIHVYGNDILLWINNLSIPISDMASGGDKTVKVEYCQKDTNIYVVNKDRWAIIKDGKVYSCKKISLDPADYAASSFFMNL